CIVTTTTGYRLPVREATLENENVAITTPSGMQLQVPLESIAVADYSMGKIEYLSDLHPVHEDWVPLIAIPENAALIRDYGLPRKDTSFGGSALSLVWPAGPSVNRSEKRAYPKGLALRSRTELEYRLPQGMRRLIATAGID